MKKILEVEAVRLTLTDLALDAANIGVWVWDLETDTVIGDETWAKLLGLDDGEAGISSQAFFDGIAESDSSRVRAAIKPVLQTGSLFNEEFQYRCGDGRTLWIVGRGQRVEGPKGETLVVGVNYDITAQKLAEEQARLVVGEMGHRMRNLISLVDGIVRLSKRTAHSKEDLAENLNQRLGALGVVNTLIIDSTQRSADARELARRTLETIGAYDRVKLDIAEVRLNPQAAQTFVLMLNELTTNAVKYGALADGDGDVRLTVSIDKATDHFQLDWSERRSAPINPPGDRKGFGSQVLKDMSQATFDGDPKYTWHENGLDYRCVWQLSRMVE